MINPIEFNESKYKTNMNYFWFDRILNFQRFFGLTYQGWNHDNSKMLHITKRVLLIIYEIIVSTLVITILYINGDLKDYSELFNSSSKKGVLAFLVRLASSAFMVEHAVNKITIFVNGPELISTVNSLHLFKRPIPLISKIKVYSYLIFYILFGMTALTISYNDIYLMTQHVIDGNFRFVCSLIASIIIATTQTSVVIIMIFTSELASQELNELVVHVNNYRNFNTICKY